MKATFSTGGTAADCTDVIHPDNAELAVQAAAALGIDIAGVDLSRRISPSPFSKQAA